MIGNGRRSSADKMVPRKVVSKLQPNTILHDAHDVIIVGAGRRVLAKRGLLGLMIVQQNKLGGSFIFFKREDHVFGVGTAMLYGLGEQAFRLSSLSPRILKLR
jgi:hypothetical protein